MKRSKSFKLFISVVCSILIAGCGSSPTLDLQPDEGMALLYLYRPSILRGSAIPSMFKINNQALGNTLGKSSFGGSSYRGYYKVSLRPGKHAIYVNGAKLSKPMIITVRAGEVVFLKHHIPNYTLTRQRNANIAKKEIGDLELLQGNFSVMNETYTSPEDIAWRACETSNSIQSCESFLTNYSNSGNAANARRTLDQLKHQEAQKTLNAKFERDKQLPVEVRRDKYMVALTSHLKNERYQEAMQYFGWLERLNTKLAPSFNYFYGEALLKTGKPDEAISKFYAYIKKVGAKGKYYKKSLELVNKAESM